MQQVVPENLSRGLVAEAFAWRVVVGLHQLGEAGGREGGQVGLARQRPAQAADGVFDPAFLPGGIRVAEEGRDPERLEVGVPGELGAVVEGDGLPPGRRQRGQQVGQGLRDGGGGLAGRPDG